MIKNSFYFKEHLIKYGYKSLVGLVLIVLSGCASKRDNLPIQTTFWSTPKTIVMTHVKGKEGPRYAKIGNQGLLDLAINEAMAGSIEENLKQINYNSIIEEDYYNTFKKSLETRSIKTIRGTPLSKEKITPCSSEDKPLAPYDFKHLRRDAEYALVVDMKGYGIQRKYHGFIPLGAPSGYSHLEVYLVKLSDNALQGYYKADITMPVEGEWDTPPTYKELMTSSKKALSKALHDAHWYLMHQIEESPSLHKSDLSKQG